MKIFYIILFCGLSFSCASQFQLEEKSPLGIGDAYFQKKVGGREETPVEIKIFIPVNNENLQLEKVYFRNQVANLKREEPNNYTAVFLILKNPDLVMSANPQGEYGNKIYENPNEFPFDLKENEAVVAYRDGNKTKYFKLENLPGKASQYLPVKNRKNN
ncbi:MAG TPA: hypothetical protein VFM70_10915 [Salinimicrobium sp.]|nr:hypothetical protein [Salinimicrobium sp.]